MGTLKALKLLIDLRKGWKSKTVIVNRILAFGAGLDAAFFTGELGGKIVDGAMWLIDKVPYLMVSREQTISVLVVLGAAGYQWLRAHTTESVEGK